MSVKKFFNLPNKLVPVTVNVSIYATEYMLMIDRIFSCPSGARYVSPVSIPAQVTAGYSSCCQRSCRLKNILRYSQRKKTTSFVQSGCNIQLIRYALDVLVMLASVNTRASELRLSWAGWSLELQTKVREYFTTTEKAPTRAFSLLKAPTSAFTFKTLSRHLC